MSGASGTRAGLLYIPLVLSRVQEPLIFFHRVIYTSFWSFPAGQTASGQGGNKCRMFRMNIALNLSNPYYYLHDCIVRVMITLRFFSTCVS